MKLIKVSIAKHNLPNLDYKFKNALQIINRDAQAMFVDYDHETFKDIGGIYLMKASVYKYVAIELDTLNIDYVLISKHNIKDT